MYNYLDIKKGIPTFVPIMSRAMALDRVNFKVDPQLKRECSERVGNLSTFLRRCMADAVYGDGIPNGVVSVKRGRPYDAGEVMREQVVKADSIFDEVITEGELLREVPTNEVKPAFDTMLSKLTGKDTHTN